MRIFILEDDQARITWFKRRFIHDQVTFVESCSQISEYMPPYDLICLDHDLGGRQMSNHEDNGEEFAKLLCNPPEARSGTAGPLAVIVHSMNPDGAMRIAYTMRAFVRMCFGRPLASRNSTVPWMPYPPL